MVIKTLRDAEIQLRAIRDELTKVKAESTSVINTTTVVSQEMPSSLRILLAELDIVEDGQKMIHQAFHRFDADADVRKLFVRDRIVHSDSGMEFVFNTGGPDVSVYWNTDQLFQFKGSVTPETIHFTNFKPNADDTLELGSSTEKYKEAWINILNTVTGNFDEIIVDELTAVTKITLAYGTGSLPLKTNASKEVIEGAINLSGSEVTGTLGIGKGGTNNTSFTSGQIIIYDGTKLASVAGSTGVFYVASTSGGATTLPVNVVDGYITP